MANMATHPSAELPGLEFVGQLLFRLWRTAHAGAADALVRRPTFLALLHPNVTRPARRPFSELSRPGTTGSTTVSADSTIRERRSAVAGSAIRRALGDRDHAPAAAGLGRLLYDFRDRGRGPGRAHRRGAKPSWVRMPAARSSCSRRSLGTSEGRGLAKWGGPRPASALGLSRAAPGLTSVPARRSTP